MGTNFEECAQCIYQLTTLKIIINSLQNPKESIINNDTVIDILCKIESINKNDATALLSYYKSIKNICIATENNDLCKEATEFQDNEVTFHIELKNTGNAQWSEIGKTKLINDKKSEIKANDVNLYNLKVGEEQIVTITLNISNARAGEKKSIFHLNIDGENIGEPLILTVNIKEDEQVTKMREEYWLSKEDHDSKKILKALRESNNDSKKAFDSLFSHN